jgi:hypothetical protein
MIDNRMTCIIFLREELHLISDARNDLFSLKTKKRVEYSIQAEETPLLTSLNYILPAS